MNGYSGGVILMFLDGTKSALNQRTGMILAGLGILSSVF